MNEELKQYIDTQRLNDVPDEKIMANLLEQGWDEEQIQSVMRRVEVSQQSNKKKIIVTVFIAVLAAVFVMFVIANKFVEYQELDTLLNPSNKEEAFQAATLGGVELNETEFHAGYDVGLADGKTTDVNSLILKNKTEGGSYRQGYTYGYMATCTEASGSEQVCLEKMISAQQSVIESNDAQNESTTGNIVSSAYGFIITLPEGWKVWEGLSSVQNGIESQADFISENLSRLELGEIAEEQLLPGGDLYELFEKAVNDYALDWEVGSADEFVITNSNLENFDYSNRTIEYNDKYFMSLDVNSEELVKFKAVTVTPSSNAKSVDFEGQATDTRISRLVEINGVNSTFSMGRRNAEDPNGLAIISYPVDLSSTIDGDQIKSLQFSTWILFEDENQIQEFVDLIESLEIINIE